MEMKLKRQQVARMLLRKVMPLVAILFLIGCDKEDNTNPIDNHPITGYWQWYLTIEPWPYEEITPATAGYDAALQFETDGTVKRFRNDTLIGTYPYIFKYRINNHLDPNSDSTLVIVINHGTETFFSIEHDTLILDQTYVDGPRDYYRR
jgi:hypothetical protein